MKKYNKNSSEMSLVTDNNIKSSTKRKKNSSEMSLVTQQQKPIMKKLENKKRKREPTQTKENSNKSKDLKKHKTTFLKSNLFQIEITNPEYSGSKKKVYADCVVCTFEALGVLTLSQAESQRKKIVGNGLPINRILEIIGKKYPKRNFKFESVSKENIDVFLKNEIRPNHAIFAAFSHKYGGHAVVLYRTSNNQLGFMDFQQEPIEKIIGYENILQKLTNELYYTNNFHVLTYYFKN